MLRTPHPPPIIVLQEHIIQCGRPHEHFVAVAPDLAAVPHFARHTVHGRLTRLLQLSPRKEPRPGQTIEGKQSNSIFTPIFDKKSTSKVDPGKKSRKKSNSKVKLSKSFEKKSKSISLFPKTIEYL